jgi:ADP-heptose:LPS heptosyltransferase
VRIAYEKPRWHELWDRNPRIARPNDRGDFQVLTPRVNGLRPYCRSKTPERWTWQEWRPPAGEIYFAHDEKAIGKINAGAVVIEPYVKAGASPNKLWPVERWQELAIALGTAGHRVVQLGRRGTRVLSGCRLVETVSIRHAAAVLANAKAAVLTEGALHHIAAGVGTPTVVIFGGYISPAVTGYDSQVSLFTGEGLGCGWRTPCKCCEAAMNRITVKEVTERTLGLLRAAA